jgi:hypothetical protein
MSYSADQLIVLASNLEQLASEFLDKTAEKKKELTEEEQAKKDHPANWSDKDWSKYLSKDKKDTNKADDKKKLDPKAKVRNRGTVCVLAEHAKDKKDHFPINDEGQARSALSRVEGLTSAPWYNGSLEGLRALVKRKVHSKYPSIGKDKKKSSSAEALIAKYGSPVAELASKYGQAAPQFPPALVKDLQQSLNSIAGHLFLTPDGIMGPETITALQHFLMSGGRNVSWTPESSEPFADVVAEVKSWVGVTGNEKPHHTRH